MSWRRCNTNRNPNLWKSCKNHHPVKMFLHEPLTSWIFPLQFTEVSSACKPNLPARSPLILSVTAYLFWIQECSSQVLKDTKMKWEMEIRKSLTEFSRWKNTYLPAKTDNLCSFLCQWVITSCILQNKIILVFGTLLFLIINHDKPTKTKHRVPLGLTMSCQLSGIKVEPLNGTQAVGRI